MAHASQYTVHTAGVDELRASQVEWAPLVAAMRYPTVFCGWEWIYTWWEHFSAGYDLRLLMVRRDGQLRAILPLFSEQRLIRWDGRLGRVLGYCGVPYLYPDPVDVIGAEADVRECVRAIIDHLRTDENDWDVIHLRFLAEDSHWLRAISDARWDGGMHVEQISVAPYIPISGSYDDYLRTLSSNERSNVRRRRRKLLEDQNVVYTNFGPDDRQTVLQDLFRLHAKRAVQKKVRSTFSQDNVMAFQKSLLDRLGPDQMWLRGLRHADEVIAIFCGYVAGRSIAYYQLGYDPAWAMFSPGSVLLQETIHEAFDSGFSEYNFLQGDEDFKYRWTSAARPLYAVDIFNQSFCGRLSRSGVAARRLLKFARPDDPRARRQQVKS